MKTSDFDFELPDELIAHHPLPGRDASRMLVVNSVIPRLDRGTQVNNDSLTMIVDKHVRDFLDYIQPGDVVVFNNSRVIPARFNAGDYEITLHTAETDKIWWGLCKKFNKLNIGDTLTLDDKTIITVLDKNDDSGIKIKFESDDVFAVLEKVGKMPLPPYMKRNEEIADRERYQTVYAKPLGSMAAPTAGLHFTDDMLREIENRGAKIVNITLHVGAGTWMPVKSDDLSEHKMHSEWGCITAPQADIINAAKRVIAIGTTSLRLLESAAVDVQHDNRIKNKSISSFNLPFNSNLVARAAELRKAGSLPEALLWNEIKGKKINGLDFDRQKIIGNYIVDFYCPTNNVVIEIDDAATHDNKGVYDEKRDKYLHDLGLTVMHIPAKDVLKNPGDIGTLLKTTPSLRATPPQEGNKNREISKNASSNGEKPSSPPVEGSAQPGVVFGSSRVAAFCGTTNIFITPGYKFRAVDVLLTNFHLPKSTLFMLVSAFAGVPEMRAAYEHAIAEKYRFFSYGDCCLLLKKGEE